MRTSSPCRSDRFASLGMENFCALNPRAGCLFEVVSVFETPHKRVNGFSRSSRTPCLSFLEQLSNYERGASIIYETNVSKRDIRCKVIGVRIERYGQQCRRKNSPGSVPCTKHWPSYGSLFFRDKYCDNAEVGTESGLGPGNLVVIQYSCRYQRRSADFPVEPYSRRHRA